MNVLLTGSSSYIARYVISALVRQNARVWGVSRRDPGLQLTGFDWIKLDLTRPVDDEVKLPEIDAVVHMAAEARLDKSAEEYFNSNLLLTSRLCRWIERLDPSVVVYTSSHLVYGQVRTAELTEESDIINPALYGMSKYLGERLLEQAAPTVSLRLPGVIGVGSYGWIDSLCRRFLADEDVQVYNSRYNHLIHAHDVAGCISTLCSNPPKRSVAFNVCADGATTALEVANWMHSRLCSRSRIKVSDEVRAVDYLISNRKLRDLYQPMDIFQSLDLFVSEIQGREQDG